MSLSLFIPRYLSLKYHLGLITVVNSLLKLKNFHVANTSVKQRIQKFGIKLHSLRIGFDS